MDTNFCSGSWMKALWSQQKRVHSITKMTFGNENYIRFCRHDYAAQYKGHEGSSVSI